MPRFFAFATKSRNSRAGAPKSLPLLFRAPAKCSVHSVKQFECSLDFISIASAKTSAPKADYVHAKDIVSFRRRLGTAEYLCRKPRRALGHDQSPDAHMLMKDATAAEKCAVIHRERNRRANNCWR